MRVPGSNPPAVVAIDLGAESCRVSLLTWDGDRPRVDLVHRFRNSPVHSADRLHWDLDGICAGLDAGLRLCAERTDEIAAIGVDGWAVDYVRLAKDGQPIAAPYCYRDPRTVRAEALVHERISRERLFAISGVQPLKINTIYQLAADAAEGIDGSLPWVNLPEYVLSWLGGRVISEYSNGTHTGLLDARTRNWSEEIFETCGLDISAAPAIAETGAVVGTMTGPLTQLAAFLNTRLIAPACHDTASAVAGISLQGDDWGYISSGTWSLIGTVLQQPITTPEAFAAGFTSFGGAARQICFHRNLNGMWILRQCIDHLCHGSSVAWSLPELVQAASELGAPRGLLDLDDASLLLPGDMPARINAQRVKLGFAPIEESAEALPQFANVLFHSLAARYAVILKDVGALAGKRLQRLCMVGGGSLNGYLNALTAEATGLQLSCSATESATVGNFSVQLATLEGQVNSHERIAYWADVLTRAI